MDANLEWVSSALSPERLRPYLDACAGRSDAALRLYTWNIQVSAAFDGPLHWFEIVLRNGLHRELERKFGRGDWWRSPSVRLHSHAHERIREAERQLGRLAVNSPAGKVVAELSLGFWVGLVSAGKGMNYDMCVVTPGFLTCWLAGLPSVTASSCRRSDSGKR